MSQSILEDDLLQRLGNLPSIGELAEARIEREAATVHAQRSYDRLFGVEFEDSVGLPLELRLQVAASVAEWNGDHLLAEHYRQKIMKDGAISPNLRDAALAYAERVTFYPAKAEPKHLQELLDCEWSLASIVTLAQVVAFVNFQTRLFQGLRLLAGVDQRSGTTEDHVAAGAWRKEVHTASGRKAPFAFTRKELGWEPWISPRIEEDLLPAERETLASFDQLSSDYFRLLAHNLPVLEERTLTDRGIFYTQGGLPRPERELAATVASKVNGCIFCASVHARKAAQLSRREAEVDSLLAVSPGGDLSVGAEPRWKEIIDFAAELSHTPPRPDGATLNRLRGLGLSPLELLDLVQSTAFFAWANRLMLTLGEPFVPEEK